MGRINLFVNLCLAVFWALLFWTIIPFILIKLNSAGDLPEISLPLSQIGLLLILSGISLATYSSGLFGIVGKGTPSPLYPPSRLVKRGAYRYTRNPIYLGHLAVSLGQFIIFGHILLFLYCLLAFAAFSIYVVLVEEPLLRKRFGKPYEDYCRRVRRWLIF